MSVMTMAMVAAIEGGDRADVRRRTAGRPGSKSGQQPADQVDAGGDHGRGVDQGADRGGAFHRVGQPDVQGKLRPLADGSRMNRQISGRRSAARRDGARVRPLRRARDSSCAVAG